MRGRPQNMKQRVEITTVDPSNRTVEVKLRDNVTVPVAVWETGAAFRWPQVGEFWSIYYENGYPVLGGRLQETTQTFKVEDLTGSDVRIDGDTIYDAQGRKMVAISDTPADGQVPVWSAVTSKWISESLSGSGLVPDASTTQKGIVKLAGDLAGTATAPTVPGLAAKENTANRGIAGGYAPLDISAKVPTTNLPDASGSAKGLIQLAGDLSGSAASPQIAPGAVTDTEVAAANKDGTAVTPSMRTLGTGAQQAVAGNDSRLSDSRTPSGAAGGDLGGTYPNPTVLLTGDGTYVQRSGNTLSPVSQSDPTAPGLGGLTVGSVALARVLKAVLRGNGITASWTITHNLNTWQPVLGAVVDGSGVPIDISWHCTTANDIVVDFVTAPTTSAIYRITIIG